MGNTCKSMADSCQKIIGRKKKETINKMKKQIIKKKNYPGDQSKNRTYDRAL